MGDGNIIIGNILKTENQKVRINGVIEVKNGLNLHKTQTKTVKNSKGYVEFE